MDTAEQVEERRTSPDSMWIEVEGCPICDDAQSTHFESVQDRDESIDYRLCDNCGVVYQSPRMSGAALEQYYRVDYITQHQRAEGVSDKEIRVQTGRARNLIELLQRNGIRPDRLLDIGSSAGVLMGLMQRTFGCQAIGVEPSEDYRRYTDARGLQTYSTLEELQANGVGRFDLIMMAHVLEHLPDPVGYLSELREKWLAPAGSLLVEVPNLFGHFSLERPHLFAFHQHTLRHALARSGFKTIELIVHGAPRSRLIPLYLTAIARPSSERLVVRSSATAVRLRRRLGMAWHRLVSRWATRWAWLPLPALETDR